MDSSSGWATTSSTLRLLLPPRRGGMKCGFGGTQVGAGKERILPREIAQRSTAPAAKTVQIHPIRSGGRRAAARIATGALLRGSEMTSGFSGRRRGEIDHGSGGLSEAREDVGLAVAGLEHRAGEGLAAAARR